MFCAEQIFCGDKCCKFTFITKIVKICAMRKCFTYVLKKETSPDNYARSKVKVVFNNLFKLCIGLLSSAICVHINRQGLSNSNSIRDLHKHQQTRSKDEHDIRVLADIKFGGGCANRQTAKLSSPPNFPAIW